MANLKDDANKALNAATELATERFGKEAVAKDPRLVVEVALLLAQLHDTRISGVIATKKKA
jgi:hypothetical protein